MDTAMAMDTVMVMDMVMAITDRMERKVTAMGRGRRTEKAVRDKYKKIKNKKIDEVKKDMKKADEQKENKLSIVIKKMLPDRSGYHFNHSFLHDGTGHQI